MTTQTVELDPETGLALLPEGYIWRVDTHTSQYLELKLIRVDYITRSYSKWIFWREELQTKTETNIAEDWFDVQSLTPHVRDKDTISHGLASLSERIYREWSRKREQDALLVSFRGDYPPKNLHSV